jgi:hypothetical protein
VTPEHLRIAQGNVRCGQCRNVFSALGNLTEEPPQVAFEDNDSELEEEIFIDEGELEDFAEEYSEEFYVIEEEIEDEIEEEFEEEFNEDNEDEALSPASPSPEAIDVEKTNIIPPQTQPPAQAQSNRSNHAQQWSTPNSSKLSEAIATIEKLKQSYSNLSFRQLEKRDQIPNIATPKQDESHQPPEPAPPSKKPDVEPSSQPTNDIAFEHYTDDDGVDYEEALNALNDLKIIEEESEEPLNDEISEPSEQIAPQEEPQSAEVSEEAVDFQNDLSLDEADIVGEDQALFADHALRDEILSDGEADDQAEMVDANGGVKVKSLDRKAREQSEAKVPAPPTAPKQPTAGHVASEALRAHTIKEQALENQPKYLPAIPKQLLEDFHPQHEHDSRHHTAVTLWSIGSILLMVVFLVQTVYFKHNDLARVTLLRPWVEKFCGLMSCELGLPSDVRRLELVSQDIRSHPKVKSALLVTTTIINNAPFTQSYPGLQITFSDLNGQRVAMRRFAPNEYLTKDMMQETGMPPNTPIQVELEMMDPGSNAVNFEFDFIPLS